MYKMKRIKNSLKITAILCVFFFLLSCTLGDSDKSSVILIVTRIIGQSVEGNDADYLASDVADDDPAPPIIVFTNPVIAILEVKFKNPEPLLPGTSYKTSVMIDRYTVTYTSPRGDPVPAAFEGRLAVVCEVDASVSLEILAVRAEAKEVPPLSTIGGGNLEAVAEIRFIGHDLEGNGVEATGYLTIYFANWADT